MSRRTSWRGDRRVEMVAHVLVLIVWRLPARNATCPMNAVLIQAYGKKSSNFGLTPYIVKVEMRLSFSMSASPTLDRDTLALAVHTGFDHDFLRASVASRKASDQE
jgi:hypothetical protein